MKKYPYFEPVTNVLETLPNSIICASAESESAGWADTIFDNGVFDDFISIL